MMSSWLTLDEVMPTRNSILAAILITKTFNRRYALLDIRDLSHGDRDINDRFSGEPADRGAAHVLNCNQMFTYSVTQSCIFFGKQLMPEFRVRHQPHYSFR